MLLGRTIAPLNPCMMLPTLQGWRLDPILLFGQLLTAGAAMSFAVETLRLREVVHKKEVATCFSAFPAAS